MQLVGELEYITDGVEGSWGKKSVRFTEKSKKDDRLFVISALIVTLRNEQYQQLISGHTKKISRLLAVDTNIDEHIKNISSYRLSFFQKLELRRGLNFAFPQRISPREIQATFEKAYWKLEPKLSSDNKELAAATLRSIALNYSERKDPAPPKAMLRAISQL